MNQPYGQQPYQPGQQPFPGQQPGQPFPGQQQYPGQPQPGYPGQQQPYPGPQPTQPYQAPPSGGFPAQQPPPGAYPGGPGGPGGYPGQQPQQQFPPTQPGHGRLVLDTSFLPLAFILNWFKPTLTINGRPGPIEWGQTPIDLPPGQYHVKVHFHYIFMDAGPAEAMIPIAEGQNVPVFYRAPAFMFAGGAIGPVPQPTPALVPMIAIMAVIFLLALLPLLLI
ncbi:MULTISPECIES: hypothetical protein [unclassified Crossiella]|uniref:hypothetical protein n=1 Tax=unclassified Crossiella TaxID=2620835 RepID=UPI001FFFA114|nr:MULTISPECIES: hypothetical protein [unclassified Crossiella]MCK2242426.1 hypothetical protein [Crossiella sp. S99.2]MCK2254543.1 hypothetical protein [Crossiella sp. S99.1]